MGETKWLRGARASVLVLALVACGPGRVYPDAGPPVDTRWWTRCRECVPYGCTAGTPGIVCGGLDPADEATCAECIVVCDVLTFRDPGGPDSPGECLPWRPDPLSPWEARPACDGVFVDRLSSGSPASTTPCYRR